MARVATNFVTVRNLSLFRLMLRASQYLWVLRSASASDSKSALWV